MFGVFAAQQESCLAKSAKTIMTKHHDESDEDVHHVSTDGYRCCTEGHRYYIAGIRIIADQVI